MRNNNEYSITAVKDMVEIIDEENVDRFLVDLRDYLITCRKNRIATAKKIGIPPFQLEAEGFVWVDDGQTGGPIRNEVLCPNGEIKQVVVNREDL